MVKLTVMVFGNLCISTHASPSLAAKRALEEMMPVCIWADGRCLWAKGEDIEDLFKLAEGE
jgi:hypothetical protein